MPKMVQIRDVPDHVHSTLKARAAREGMSLSDYIKRELKHVAERPSMTEWLDKVTRTKPIRGKVDSVELIRELRDAR